MTKQLRRLEALLIEQLAPARLMREPISMHTQGCAQVCNLGCSQRCKQKLS